VREERFSDHQVSQRFLDACVQSFKASRPDNENPDYPQTLEISEEVQLPKLTTQRR
jgi:hypothetical protein